MRLHGAEITESQITSLVLALFALLMTIRLRRERRRAREAAVTRLAVLGHSPPLHALARAAPRGIPGGGAGVATRGRADHGRGAPRPARGAGRRGTLGVSLTHPLKAAVLPLLSRVSAAARLARSVNTVGLAESGGGRVYGRRRVSSISAIARALAGAPRVLLLEREGGAQRGAGAARGRAPR